MQCECLHKKNPTINKNKKQKKTKKTKKIKQRNTNKNKKERQLNGQKKGQPTIYKNTTQKTKDRAKRTPLKTGGELRCSGRISSVCSTSYTHRVTQKIIC
jgi:hypothetical protein